MAAYYATTFMTSPLRHFFFQEHLYTILLYVFQVINHAHMVKSAVASVESLQPMAGEIPAFITEPHNSFPQQFTLPFVVTILVAR